MVTRRVRGWRTPAGRRQAGVLALLWGWALLVAVGYRDLSTQAGREERLRGEGPRLAALMENFGRDCRAETLTLAFLERRLEDGHQGKVRELMGSGHAPEEKSRRLVRLEQSWERERTWRRALIRSRAWRRLALLASTSPEPALLALALASNRPESCLPLSWQRESFPPATWGGREPVRREGEWEEGRGRNRKTLRRYRRQADLPGGGQAELTAVFDWAPAWWLGVVPVTSPLVWLLAGMLVLASGLVLAWRLVPGPAFQDFARARDEEGASPQERSRRELAEKDLSLATEMIS